MKIGFTCGAFDLFHAGHVTMLQEAKSVCDYLIVGIQINPHVEKPEKNSPIQTIIERQIQVKACRYVDEIIVYATVQDLEDLLSMLPIDIRIIGTDHRGIWKSAREMCDRRNITVYYNKRDHRFSTTELRERIKKS